MSAWGRGERDLMRTPSALAAWLGMSILVQSWCGAAQLDEPSKAELQAIESSVVLPPGAEPVAAYARYYANISQGGHRIIRGIYVFGDEARIVITTAEKLPAILDGGCVVVTIEYDVSTATFLQVSCNGEA
jgi:hypothetical protein